MSVVTQNIVVFIVLAACLAMIARSALRTFRQKKGGLGSCCSKGCEAAAHTQAVGRTVFVPSDTLRRKK
jgi:hypothetical protein